VRPAGTIASSLSTSSAPSTTISPTPPSTAIVISSVVLAFSMKHDQRRIDPSLECGEDLTAAGHIEAKSLLDHDALHCRTGESFRGEDDTCIGPAAGQFSDIFSGACAERFLGDHEHGRTEFVSKIIYATITDDQHAVGIRPAAWRQEIQQFAHGALCALSLSKRQGVLRQASAHHPLSASNAAPEPPPQALHRRRVRSRSLGRR
jgi:hypothetical protein